MKSLSGCYNNTKELRAIAMYQFLPDYQQGLYEAIIASQSLDLPVEEYMTRTKMNINAIGF